MKILLFGKNGQVGWELQRSLAPLGRNIALDQKGCDGLCGELTDFEGLRRTIREIDPDVIVNAAAYTAVDLAETEKDLAHTVNALAPGVLAEEAKSINALIVHYSTDYIFDGSGERPWQETDKAAPLNVYGSSKWLGEQAIREAGSRSVILRTQWVYAARGKNFIRTILRLAAERDAMQVIDDQFGAPTGSEMIADVTAHIIRSTVINPKLAGTYNLAARGETSWHGYARFVIDIARNAGWPIQVEDEAIAATSSDAFAVEAERPRNSRLAVDKLESKFDLTLPEWRTGVRRAVMEMQQQ